MFMKAGQYPLYFLNVLLIILCLGIMTGDAFSLALSWQAAVLAVCGLIAALLLYRSSAKAFLPFGIIFFLLGSCSMTMGKQLPAQDIGRYEGQELQLTAVVVEAPQLEENSDGTISWRCVAEAEHGALAGEGRLPLGGRSYVSWRQGHQAKAPPVIRIGDRIQMMGKVHGLHGYQNPGTIDRVRSARAQGITARFSVGRQGISVESREGFYWRRYLEEVRAGYAQQMAAVMPPTDAAAIFAMLFGGYEGIRPELLEAFTVTGIIHILSVSGSHITLLAGTGVWLAGLLGLGRVSRTAFVLLLLAGYSMLAGCVPPVIRSAMMGGLAFTALAIGREKDARYLLSITGMGMLVLSPFLLFAISFQLSFLATAGLLYLSPRIGCWLGRYLPQWMAGSLAVTIGAQLSVLPVLAWYFHRVSVSALLANLLAVPIVEAIIVLGLFAGLAGWFLPFLSQLIFIGDSLLLGLVYEVTRLLAALPGSQLYLPTMKLPVVFGWYLLLLLLWQWGKCRELYRRSLPYHGRSFLAGGLLVLLLLCLFHAMRPAEMAVHFIDVGQGDAALVITPHGHAFMVDTGGTRENAYDIGGRVDVPYLLYYGVRHLDGIFLTHVHEDHAAGAGGIVKHLSVGRIYTASEGPGSYMKTMQLSPAQLDGKSLQALREGQVLEIDGVHIEVLSAPQISPLDSRATGNEVSNVLRVSYGKASFLFTGDMVQEQEAALLARAQSLQSTVLKVAHHGSKTSSTMAFLQAVQPRWAVVSVGAGNSFGHPSPEVLQRFTMFHTALLRTDQMGAVVFHTDGQRMRVERFVE